MSHILSNHPWGFEDPMTGSPSNHATAQKLLSLSSAMIIRIAVFYAEACISQPGNNDIEDEWITSLHVRMTRGMVPMYLVMA